MLNSIITGVIALVLGLAAGYLLRKTILDKKIESAESKAEKMLVEAKKKYQETLLEAKDKALKFIDDAKIEEKARRQGGRRLLAPG